MLIFLRVPIPTFLLHTGYPVGAHTQLDPTTTGHLRLQLCNRSFKRAEPVTPTPPVPSLLPQIANRSYCAKNSLPPCSALFLCFTSEDLARVGSKSLSFESGPAVRLSRCLRETALFLPPCRSACFLPSSRPASPSSPAGPLPPQGIFNMASGDGCLKCRLVSVRQLDLAVKRRAPPGLRVLCSSPGVAWPAGASGLRSCSPGASACWAALSAPRPREPGLSAPALSVTPPGTFAPLLLTLAASACWRCCWLPGLPPDIP